jgi:hypothetical protein
VAQRLANYPIIANSAGTTTNPSATVMADTGALQSGSGGYNNGGGIYEILVTASATAAAPFTLQRRNAANGANVGSTFVFRCPANSTVAVPFRLEAEANERFRVLCTVTGDAEAGIMVQRVG